MDSDSQRFSSQNEPKPRSNYDRLQHQSILSSIRLVIYPFVVRPSPTRAHWLCFPGHIRGDRQNLGFGRLSWQNIKGVESWLVNSHWLKHLLKPSIRADVFIRKTVTLITNHSQQALLMNVPDRETSLDELPHPSQDMPVAVCRMYFEPGKYLALGASAHWTDHPSNKNFWRIAKLGSATSSRSLV